ncbi:probable low-specificity L-threonine aldolase 2 isoform X2 [Coturnix japonica]|uniref:probable low-specificity L-threonine aldolase 2 isoform X2 n=1 Tax=Coturnix japonica TaxID=93934 RepID=UPI0013A5DF87|nr:probable low-specificity L-threonine aldolase 2 isoform X2 [Coturnix japonica]
MLAMRAMGAALRRALLHGAGSSCGGAAMAGDSGGGGGAGSLRVGAALGRPQHVVDLRSDTVTQPSAAMRGAMARAAVGDDDYGEDPTVNELQQMAARILGMEDALFVPTATMANLIAVMCHCQRRGAQLLLGAQAHMYVYEHGGAAQVAGVHSQALQDLPDGTLDLEQLELAIREAHGSRYHPRPELICLENTHSSAGGRALPLTYLQQVHLLAECYGLRVHMDGARLMNAAVAQGVDPAHIAQHCDSVSLCFSKGLGAPAGAVLAGRREFVAEAWRVRKLLGGGMRQAGVLAAAARIGLEQAEETLRRDHDNARHFAQAGTLPRPGGLHGRRSTPENMQVSHRHRNRATSQQHNCLSRAVPLMAPINAPYDSGCVAAAPLCSACTKSSALMSSALPNAWHRTALLKTQALPQSTFSIHQLSMLNS